MLFSVNFYGQTVDDDDTQLWNETTLEFPIYNNSKDKEIVSGVIIGNLRLTDNVTDLSDKRIGFGTKIKVHKYITVTPSYLFRLQTSAGPNRYEHRARLDITPKKSWKNFSLENRNRFEYRLKTAGRSDEAYYRNQTKLAVPVKSKGKTLFSPFVANDTYFDLRNPSLYRNDTVGGISKKFSKSTTVDFFYQYRRNFESSQKVVHVIGINLKFSTEKRWLFSR